MMQQQQVRWQLKELSESGIFRGYASMFGTRDDHGDIVEPQAFADSLQRWQQSGRWPAMLWMHDPSRPVGRWRSLAEDDKGLWVEGQLALRTQQGREAYELLQLGAVNGLSIGFRLRQSRYDAAAKARRLLALDLIEISLVTFPANPAARVMVVKAARRRLPSQRKGESPSSTGLRAASERLKAAARKLKNQH